MFSTPTLAVCKVQLIDEFARVSFAAPPKIQIPQNHSSDIFCQHNGIDGRPGYLTNLPADDFPAIGPAQALST
jgi:hypothetical protein